MLSVQISSPDWILNFSPFQWNLICDKSSLPKLSQSGFFVGLLIGAWVFGTVTDMIGRRKVFFMSTLCAAVCNVLSGLAPGFYFFAFFRIAIAFFSAGLMLSSFSICMEITGISQRTFVGMAIHVFFGVGYLVLAVMAYFIRNWRTLSVIVGLTGFLFLLLWRCVGVCVCFACARYTCTHSILCFWCVYCIFLQENYTRTTCHFLQGLLINDVL